MPLRVSRSWFLYLILVLYCFYAACTIYLSSFVLEGVRYFTLFDDGMISMRYAWNLASGHGLVYNPGERVEGITNPLWAVYMALVQVAVPLRTLAPLLIQMTNAGFSIAIIGIVWRTAITAFPNLKIAPFVGASVVAFYYPFIFFTLHGMETGLLGLLLALALYKVAISLQKDKFSPACLILLGIATLVRIDMAILFVMTGVLLILRFNNSRLQASLWLAAFILLFLGGQTCIRWWYYGDIFPNTYYLKMTGFPAHLRVLRGLFVTWPFVFHFWPFAAMGAWVLCRERGLKHLAGQVGTDPSLQFLFYLTAVASVQVAYSIYVGGDAWEEDIFANRYVLVAWPAISLLSGVVVDAFLRRVGRRPVTGSLPAVIGSCICVFWLNFRKDVPAALPSACLKITHFLIQTNENHLWYARWFQKNVPPSASVAVDMAGLFAYHIPNVCYDMLGKCDRHVARLPMQQITLEKMRPSRMFYPGHMKLDIQHSVGALKPDYVFIGWTAVYANYLKSGVSGYEEIESVRRPLRVLERVKD